MIRKQRSQRPKPALAGKGAVARPSRRVAGKSLRAKGRGTTLGATPTRKAGAGATRRPKPATRSIKRVRPVSMTQKHQAKKR